jgi:hypothetical protein
MGMIGFQPNEMGIAVDCINMLSMYCNNIGEKEIAEKLEAIWHTIQNKEVCTLN